MLTISTEAKPWTPEPGQFAWGRSTLDGESTIVYIVSRDDNYYTRRIVIYIDPKYINGTVSVESNNLRQFQGSFTITQ